MDKCKYFLKDGNNEFTYESDKELSDFIKAHYIHSIPGNVINDYILPIYDEKIKGIGTLEQYIDFIDSKFPNLDPKEHDINEGISYTPFNKYILGSEEDIKQFKEWLENKKHTVLKFDIKENSIQDRVWEEIKKNNVPYSKNFIIDSQFLKMEHIIDGENPKLLAPVFNDENYKKEAINDLLNTKYKDLNESDPEEALRRATEEVDLELKTSNIMVSLQIIVNDILQNYIKKNPKFSIDNSIEKIIKTVENYNKLIKHDFSFTEKEKVNISQNIKEQIQKWYKQTVLNSTEKFEADVWLNRQLPIENATGISSPISYLSINSDGIPSIYDVRVSRNNITDWDSAKILRTDYKLGISRRLLEDLLPPEINPQLISLYILPAIFPVNRDGLIMADKFYIGEVNERSSSYAYKPSGLDENGIVTQTLRKLIPVKVKDNPEESTVIISNIQKTLSAMFPTYNFRTKRKIEDIEFLITKAKHRAEGRQTIKLLNRLTGEYIEEPNTEEGVERFRKRVAEYVELLNATKDTAVQDIIKEINKGKKTGKLNIKGLIYDGLNTTFQKYLSGDWELITNRPALLANGTLVFRNNKTLQVEVVTLTINNLRQINNLGLGTKVLGKFYRDSDLNRDPKIWNATSSHIEILKTLTVLNAMPDVLYGYKLGNIKVLDISSGTPDWSNNLENAFYNFDLLLKEIKDDINIENNFANKKIKVADYMEILYQEILDALRTINNDALNAYFSMEQFDNPSTNNEKIKLLTQLSDKLLETYGHLNKIDPTKITDFSDPIVYLYALVSGGISHFIGINGEFETGVNEYGMTKGDFTHMLKSWLFGEVKDTNIKIPTVGMFQGMKLATTDAVQSEYLNQIYDVRNLTQDKISSIYLKEKNKVINLTNAMYKEMGRPWLEKTFIGDADRFYSPFYEHDGNKLDSEFKLKNPWSKETALTPEQRKYLKQYIHLFYLYRDGSNQELDTFEKFEKSEELKQMLASGEIENLLKIPLIPRMNLSELKTLTTDGFRKMVGNIKENALNILDIKQETPEEAEKELQYIGSMNAINGLKKIYNRFKSQEDKEFRDYLLTRYSVGHWEINLDTILLKYIFESIKEKYFNEVLPYINAAMQNLRFYGYQTGHIEEVEKLLNTTMEQIKVSIYNVSPIKGKEYEDLFSYIRLLQKGVSFMVLAIRPAMAIKELVVGTIKNTSYAWSKVYGDDSFSGRYLTQAYKLLLSKKDYALVNELNNYFRIANRDMNQIVDKTKIDRRGLNFISDFMYWSNTAPDYINRLALFLSKLIKDGVYQAYSLDKDGNLVYDVTKDERFSYYFQMRKKYGMKDHPTDKKYNTQRALYKTYIDYFNKQAIFKNDKTYKEEDLISEPYMNLERESIKTFTELAYGYYDYDRSPLIKHLPLGIFFGQFMTFWPAKIRYYFGKPTKTKRGHMQQKFKMVNGKKVLYYVKYETDENGQEYRLEIPETELKPGDAYSPDWEWVGDPFEGLMYSFGITIRELATGKSLKEIEPHRLNNAKLMLHDLIIMLINILLGILIFKNKDLITGKTNYSQMDQYERMACKILMRSTKEFNPFSLLGDIQTTPVFISTLSDTIDSVKDVFSGNGSVESFIRSNLNFMELVPNPMARR